MTDDWKGEHLLRIKWHDGRVFVRENGKWRAE